VPNELLNCTLHITHRQHRAPQPEATWWQAQPVRRMILHGNNHLNQTHSSSFCSSDIRRKLMPWSSVPSAGVRVLPITVVSSTSSSRGTCQFFVNSLLLLCLNWCHDSREVRTGRYTLGHVKPRYTVYDGSQNVSRSHRPPALEAGGNRRELVSAVKWMHALRSPP
jgi:hypothetical protein